MSREKPPERGPFDLDRLRELVELMEKHGLSEVHLRRGDEQWRLRRGGAEPVMAAAPFVPAPAASPATHAAAPHPPSAEPKPEAGTATIKSPTVGTFYSSPSPDDPPFVTVGARIQPDTIVCLIEAMKVFNQIPAEVSGTIVEVLVANGDAVEFGQPLFRVKP